MEEPKMKLVDRVLDNISSEEIADISSEFGFSAQKMSSVINATISGVLSAFKAQIVSSMNSGDLSPLLELINNDSDTFNLKQLFNSNAAVLNVLYTRIGEFSDVSAVQISEIIPAIMPLISNAITTMLQEYGTNTIISPTGSFISDLMHNNSGYEVAINAANKFLNSVFGNKVDDTAQANVMQDSLENDSFFIQNLFDLFNQDNDGSVMDDIYRMLVR
jgi:hypothetical protein